LEQNSFQSGNILLAQAMGLSRQKFDYFIPSKKSYLAGAASRVIQNSVQYLKKHKFFIPGNSSKFQKLAYSVTDVFPLEKYSGHRKNDTRAIAELDLLSPS